MKKHFILLIVSLVIVISTLFIPQNTSTYKQMERVRYGYPISFVIQDKTTYDYDLPVKQGIHSIWENPTNINILFAFLSWFIIYGGFSILFKFFSYLFFGKNTKIGNN